MISVAQDAQLILYSHAPVATPRGWLAEEVGSANHTGSYVAANAVVRQLQE